MTNLLLDAFTAELHRLNAEAEQVLTAVADETALEQARVAFLGAKSGRIRQVQKGGIMRERRRHLLPNAVLLGHLFYCRMAHPMRMGPARAILNAMPKT